MNIQEVCKIRKEELKLTYQDISDASGVPLSTVQKGPAVCCRGRRGLNYVVSIQNAPYLVVAKIERKCYIKSCDRTPVL